MNLLPLLGGCQCKRFSYEIISTPLTLYACHCTDCQTQSTSAFGMSMAVTRESVVGIEIDKLESWSRTADSGRTVTARYCGSCGTRLFHEPSRNPKILNVKPGTLYNTSWIKPVGHLWLSSAQSWFVPPNDVLHYPKQPTNHEELIEKFTRMFNNSFV